METYTNSGYVDNDEQGIRKLTGGQTENEEAVPSDYREERGDDTLGPTSYEGSDDGDHPFPSQKELELFVRARPRANSKRRTASVNDPQILNPLELTAFVGNESAAMEPEVVADVMAEEADRSADSVKMHSILRDTSDSLTHRQHTAHIGLKEDQTMKQTFFIASDGTGPWFVNKRLRSRELGMLLSFSLCLVEVTFCVALLLNATLALPNLIADRDEWFFTFIYSTGSILLILLLVLAATGLLTKDDHYKFRRKSVFIRAGMMVLGSSTVIYRCLLFIEYATQSSECHEGAELILSIPGLALICCELSFLLVFTKIRMNKSLTVIILGRFTSMHMVAINVSIWLAVVVKESVHEIHLVSDEHHFNLYRTDAHLFADLPTTDMNGTTMSPDPYCPISDVLKSIEIYLFPLMIEYSVMVGTLWLSLWSNCGAGFLRKKTSHRRSRGRPSLPARSLPPAGTAGLTKKPSVRSISTVSGFSVASVHHGSGYRNTNLGLILGWIVLIGSIVVTFLFLYLVYTDNQMDPVLVSQMSYGSNIALSIVSIIAIPLTAWGMRALDTHEPHDPQQELAMFHLAGDYHEEYHHKVDKGLMFITFLFLLAFKCLCIMSAIHEGDNLIVTDGVISIILGLLQTTFICGYSFNKISLMAHQRRQKPGRQGLEFLRCTELALWLVNTFLLKNTAAKAVQYATFGTTAWAILGNIFQPLTILHYFHCMTCVASVISHAYSDKYIGQMGSRH